MPAFHHRIVEFTRNVLGRADATHPEFDARHPEHAEPEGEVFIEDLLCALVDQTMRIEMVDDALAPIYGTPSANERYYCSLGLSPSWREPLHDAGLLLAGVDATDGDVRIMRLANHPFYILTLFVPQTSSRPTSPHPLIAQYLKAALDLSAI